ncbi:MAG: metal ABC transporter solute-binding protein, Zn/Mn family, partial [Acidimicrobiales bacterium]
MVATVLALAVLTTGCGTAGSQRSDGRPLIVATNSIIGDVVGKVTEGRATVEVLVPVGTDPHEFMPSARAASRLREATLIVTSGLGLESRFRRLIDAARSNGVPVIEMGASVDSLPLDAAAGDGADRDEGARDPHFWTDPRRMIVAVNTLALHLDELGAGLGAGAATYVEELRAADAKVAEALADLPAERRQLVTNHETLGYFADRYDLTVIGVVIPGGSSGAEPAPAAL